MENDDSVNSDGASCSLCGRKIRVDSKAVQEPRDFIPGARVNVNGIECIFDSEFCATLFKKLQVVYGDGFCSYMAKTS